LQDHTVLVLDDRITEIGPVDEVEIPPGANRIDGDGHYLLPGLTDMHVHVWNEDHLLLLVANGFFVAAEFALVKARGFRIEALANNGSSAARLTLGIQANLEAYLAACQLGITMASLGLGWVGEPAVAALLEPLFQRLGVPESLLHSSAFLTGFLLFSSLHIVVGEQVPKTFAIRKAEPVSVWVAYPLRFVYLAVFPLNWLLNKASGKLLSLFGVEEASHGEVFSGEEIKGLVATSREHGEIHEDKADMLHNLFEFDQRLVGRVMLPRNAIHALDLNAPEEENLRVMRDSGHSRFPVIDSAREENVVGILLAKDIYRALLCGEQAPWQDLMRYCREAMVVPENQRVSQLFELMRIRRAHMAFVVDEYGAFVGIVTLEDLLEEIVGEIQDETDAEPSVAVKELAEDSWEVDGLVSLSDLERIIGLKIDEELDANTLSGLFMQRLGRMPERGDEIQERGFRLCVLSLEDHRVGLTAIQRIDVELLPAAAADES
jgi:CBS domain containing-hemolysin-like protein